MKTLHSHRPGSTLSRVAIWTGAVLAVGGMIWGLAVLGSKNSNTNVSYGTPPAVTDTDHIRGSKLAKVTLIEYSDLECPVCKRYEPMVQQMTTTFGDKLLLVYRHFPLRSVHPDAQLAAQAAEAADKQGSFWAMHDLLFDRQDTWVSNSDPKKLFGDYAKELGLKVDQFQKDIDSTEIQNKVNAAYDQATSLNLQGTPTFFLNGKTISNPTSAAAFQQLIQNAIDGKS